MVGSWGRLEVFAYELFITPNLGVLYGQFADLAAPYLEHGRVLEVGCGSGQAAIELARRHPGREFVCTDLSPEQIKNAVGRVAAAKVPNIWFKIEDALALSFPDNTFDFVFSLASVKHWPDQAQGLRECFRVLKPGGAMMVLEVDRDASAETISGFVKLWRAPFFLFPERYFRTFVLPTGLTEASALQRATEAGLRHIEVRKPDGWPFLSIVAQK